MYIFWSLCCFRGLLFAFSTAAQQKSTGDDCGPEDPQNEPRQVLRGENLEHKTIKLEEQLRVLTVSNFFEFDILNKGLHV